jgi:hypothetical protein
MMIELLRARKQLDARAAWTAETAAYVAENGIDMEAVNNHAGLLVLCRCKFHGGYFDFDDGEGVTAAVIEVYDADDESVIDLCSWPVGKPCAFATFLGSDALGMARVTNPATWAMGGALKVFRTPLGWLQAGCQGLCILDCRHVSIWLRSAVGYRIEVEDEQHGLALAGWLNPRPFDERRIMAPRTQRRQAA